MNIPFFPDRASNHAPEWDALFYTITGLTLFFTVATFSVVLYFAVRYRAGRKADRSNPQDHNTKLEVAWSVPPLLLGLVIFVWSTKVFIQQVTPPTNAMEIFCVGKQWMWHFQHANGVRENNAIHVPLGVPVKITMISQDVLHALYLPDFRVQYHVVPGRYTQVWFIPTKVGKFKMFCNMYCGTEHSLMGGYVYVQEQGDFQRWLANGGEQPNPTVVSLADQGKQLFTKMRCDNCHGEQDSSRAPTLKALYGRTVTLSGGQKIVASDEYIRESILTPYKRVVDGFEKIMPENYNFDEEKIIQLIAYIKTLGVLPTTPQANAGTGKLTMFARSAASNSEPNKNL